MPYITDANALVPLPGGGVVSVAFLANQGVPGYTARQDGTFVVPDDATFRTMAGDVGVGQYGFARQDAAPTKQDKPTESTFDGDAFARLRQILNDYELGDLSTEVEGWVRGGLSANEALLRLYEHPRFKQEFPEIDQRRQNGLAALSPGEIITYRRQARQLFKAAGLPEGFYDTKEDFSKFLANDVSLSELETRINDGYVQVMAAPAEVRQQLEQFYGITAGQMAAYFLDEARAVPTIERQVAAARVGGASVRSGFGQLSTLEAERVASLGVSEQQAQEGFGTLAGLNTGEMTGQQVDVIGRDTQIDAAFGGNEFARKRIERRQRQDAGNFQGAGGFVSSREGFSGLGSAQGR